MDAIVRPAPKIVKNLFPDEDFARFRDAMLSLDTSFKNQIGFGRFAISSFDSDIIKEFAEKSVPTARSVFNSPTLKHSYSLFCRYEGDKANLFKHKDNNACTYTLDMCVYYDVNWGLFVEDVEYFTEPNEALAYYGNDQMHWRGPFPNPESNFVGVVFFHYTEPDHWFFTKGADYINVINGEWSEAQWEKTRANQ